MFGPRNRRRMVPMLATVVVASIVLSGCLSPGGGAVSEDGKVTLRLATTQTRDSPENIGLWRMIERLERDAPWITIDYVGGPETIEPNDAAENVQSGALDMASVSSAYYTQILPEAEVFDLTPNDPAVDRESGALELINSWHEEVGLHVLGVTIAEMAYMLHFGSRWSEIDITEPDLTGWLMRGGPTQQPMLEALGAEVVNMPVGEIYTAMERGTIDGFAAGNSGMYDLGIAEPIKASYMAPYLTIRYPLLMNLQTWLTLDERTREALSTAMAELERSLPDIYRPVIEGEYQRWAEDGKELLEPTEGDVDRFQARARDIGWELLVARTPRAAEVRELYEVR
ncbi:TRAP-type C4-dicarboxylate transport system substrate-binding protein [Tamaricihabitans halophyticus]|uniref:TRAP-type C4-dicarboxylate transport system substrate-binding protein n=1 Tax=Tamaricihabitans halophyticus TaxID=1262583 RepID=A0A4R2R0V0_9PSEU|nr:TRAP transporter substrate-binding protein DctP [Tamaricihabitans halophyticus]TCP53071.1 TRAP-type C4-dicarboxylate transport system substrate-binding protein [Tamaricihabitans halophyticus]